MSIPKSFTIQTARLKMRIPSEEDIQYVFSASQFEGFNEGMLWDAPKDPNALKIPLMNNLKSWEKGTAYSFSIENKETGEFLGRITIRKTDKAGTWNTGFWMHPSHQGKGFMTEALKAIIDFGFMSLSANAIEACHAVWNKASEKVLLRNGMKFSQYLEKGFLKNGKWVEENLLSINRQEWGTI